MDMPAKFYGSFSVGFTSSSSQTSVSSGTQLKTMFSPSNILAVSERYTSVFQPKTQYRSPQIFAAKIRLFYF
jgi:hypothetical protein